MLVNFFLSLKYWKLLDEKVLILNWIESYN